MSNFQITPIRYIKGEIELPPDKSIFHRALILSSLAQGKSKIKKIQRGEDCLSTLNNLKLMGVKIEEKKESLLIYGEGLRSLKEPPDILNCGNSATTMRLLAGVIAGQGFYSVLSGDEYLKKRPMKRITEPLRKMGAKVFGREDGQFPPLTLAGGRLRGIHYSSPIPSAQVKSCILLAGLFAEGDTSVTEPLQSRDHTERMLRYLGGDLEIDNLKVTVKEGSVLEGKKIFVPGDISGAAFFIAGAVILGGSELKIINVGLNPTRRGFLDILIRMGAEIEIISQKTKCEEEVGNLLIKGGSELEGIVIEKEIIPQLIDEIPILAVVACFAQGETVIRGAKELRFKETDRIKAIVEGLRKMGANIEEKEDGMVIRGGKKLKGGECQSYGDHRIAMALTIAALGAKKKSKIIDVECINTSFPEFREILKNISV